MSHFTVVLQTLKEHQLFAKCSKCEFLLRSMTFFGHIISSEGFEVDPRKTEVVKNLQRPLTPIDIRSFLGLVGYYRSLKDGFAYIVSPLTTLTQKYKKFKRSEACENIVEMLKDRVSFAPLNFTRG